MTDTQHIQTDLVTVFQLDKQPIRGRTVKLGPALDQALNPHGEARYPESVARLLGEAMMTGALVAQSLKFKGRLVVQCHGTNEGAVSLLMADCTTDGHIRGYARWNADKLKEIELDTRNPGADILLGAGTFSMTIDQGPDMDQYQGISAIEGTSLSSCAEHYFNQSEQIPTRIKLACGQSLDTDGAHWSGGGMMIQKIADDEARADATPPWETAQQLFATLSDAELIDPELTMRTADVRVSAYWIRSRVLIKKPCKIWLKTTSSLPHASFAPQTINSLWTRYNTQRLEHFALTRTQIALTPPESWREQD